VRVATILCIFLFSDHNITTAACLCSVKVVTRVFSCFPHRRPVYVAAKHNCTVRTANNAVYTVHKEEYTHIHSIYGFCNGNATITGAEYRRQFQAAELLTNKPSRQFTYICGKLARLLPHFLRNAPTDKMRTLQPRVNVARTTVPEGFLHRLVFLTYQSGGH
jgi:hypothetical protein